MIASGTRLGPYEITGSLGAGGMGEVYKARDTRLDRIVAIKVLPQQAHQDQQARERFEREARAISALNHPHICTLHDIGRQDSMDFLVMEYVEGDTLAARLAKGPLPLNQALTYAIDLASALDRAHRAGIVHRDLKPGNVMVSRAGIKLLDFGLAKAFAPAEAGASTRGEGRVLSPADSATKSGLIVGTVQYMAPEQIESGTIDARTDIFAFGALLYEMVSGRKAFEASSVGSLIAAIVEEDPPRLSFVQPLAPPALDRVVATCLAKDPDDRWQTARDLMRELQWIVESSGATRVVAQSPAPNRRRSFVLTGGLAAVFGSAFTALAMWLAPPDTSSPIRNVRFAIYPERGTTLSTPPASVVAPQLALSPDGSRIAYVATSNGPAMIWVRALDALHAQVLSGTEDATYPFWSSDSRSLGFFAGNKLKRVSLAGEAPVVLTDASLDSRGATWSTDGTMIATLQPYGGLSHVSADGLVLVATSLNRASGETSHRWPSFLPDGRHFLYTARHADEEKGGLFLTALGEGNGGRLRDGDLLAAAAVDGHLFFLRGNSLVAQPLDLENRRLSGQPVPLIDEIGTTTTGYAAFTVSRTGTLAYAEPWPLRGELIWFSRDGRPLGAPIAELADYVGFALSPDGTRLALARVDPQANTPDIWQLDLTRTSMTRVTSDPSSDTSVLWSPDGSRIVFRSNRRGANYLYSRPANGSRPEELLAVQPRGDSGEFGNFITTDWSRDGSYLLLTNSGGATSFDLWVLSMGDAQPGVKPVSKTAFNEYHGVFAPDNRWIAYVSEETGVAQVYVQSFPDGEQRWQVSSQGGTEPQWRNDGRELFFLNRDRTLMAVSVSLEPVFKAELPKALFPTRVPVTGIPHRHSYRVAADGQRFLINTAPLDAPAPAIHVVLDWRALLAGRE